MAGLNNALQLQQQQQAVIVVCQAMIAAVAPACCGSDVTLQQICVMTFTDVLQSTSRCVQSTAQSQAQPAPSICDQLVGCLMTHCPHMCGQRFMHPDSSSDNHQMVHRAELHHLKLTCKYMLQITELDKIPHPLQHLHGCHERHIY